MQVEIKYFSRQDLHSTCIFGFEFPLYEPSHILILSLNYDKKLRINLF